MRTDRRKQRDLGLRDDVEDGERIRCRGRSDQRVDVMFADQFLGVLHRARGVATVLELDILDGRVADVHRQQRGGVLLGNADRRGRPRGRNHQPDLDLRGSGSEAESKRQGDDQCTNEHDPVSSIGWLGVGGSL